MDEDKGGSRANSTFADAEGPHPPHPPHPPKEANQRQRFHVEMKPSETTIVSWKRLIKDMNNAIPSLPPSSDPPCGAHPALESRISPVGVGQSAECELKDEPPPNRFSAVIQKIERLYMGKQSSDEEELDNIPDEDEYDTEDSFIDDAELDEYFQVDKLATKHNGFFVNRGKLEKINEPTLSPNHPPKKWRRKDLPKARGEMDGENIPNQHVKMGNVRMKAATRSALLVGPKSSGPSQISTPMNEHYQDGKLLENLSNAHVRPSEKKSGESTIKSDHSSVKMPSKDSPTVSMEAKEIKKRKTGVIQSRDLANKSKVTIDSSDAIHKTFHNKDVRIQIVPQSKKLLNDTNNMELSTKIQYREKNGSSELHEMNSSGGKYSVHKKSSPMPVKEGSNVRPKGTMLERAIRELENIVQESRPQTMEVQETDASSQGVKKRLPQDVKQKLAKVARLAQSCQGKISEELINRLMGILGHLVQLKTLKRNLKEMVELGLSAKQAKADRFQLIKKEVIEMIRTRLSSFKSKAAEHRDGSSDDFQEVPGSVGKGTLKGRFIMDDAMEDKICDLYDLYVEGMDEDRGPQSRKLYVELAELWPNGYMDNNGIKGAVCRAKERRRQLYKDQVKMRRKKMSPSLKTEQTALGEASLNAQPRVTQEKLTIDSSTQVFTSPDKLNFNPTTSSQHHATSARSSNPSLNTSTLDLPKQDKVRPRVSSAADEVGKATDVTVLKKKLKRKPDSDLGEIHVHPMKVSSQHHEKERHKSHKHSSNHLQPSSNHQVKPSLPSSGIPGTEQPS
ncbi:ubinuclein-1-like [Tasmannia lanceolata]|uniref:ubinuclein-1-like n=1 Tax=Tasmannia lanceolata TaxID=3420 RepID=UPI0040627E09